MVLVNTLANAIQIDKNKMHSLITLYNLNYCFQEKGGNIFICIYPQLLKHVQVQWIITQFLFIVPQQKSLLNIRLSDVKL